MEERNRRISDTGWRRFITVELVTTVLVGFFLAGGVWVTLSEDLIRAQAAINKHSLEYIDISHHVTRLDKDIALIALETSQNTEISKDIKSNQKDIQKDIKEILRVVQR